MPTTKVSPTVLQDAFVAKVVKAGDYRNASEALRVQIEAGLDALKRGQFVEVEDAELQGYLCGLRPGTD